MLTWLRTAVHVLFHVGHWLDFQSRVPAAATWGPLAPTAYANAAQHARGRSVLLARTVAWPPGLARARGPPTRTAMASDACCARLCPPAPDWRTGTAAVSVTAGVQARRTPHRTRSRTSWAGYLLCPQREAVAPYRSDRRAPLAAAGLIPSGTSRQDVAPARRRELPGGHDQAQHPVPAIENHRSMLHGYGTADVWRLRAACVADHAVLKRLP